MQYDVRIAIYQTKKGTVGHVRFTNDVEGLIDSDYIKLSGKGTKLYFMPTDSANGVKLTNVAQINKRSHIDFLRDWVGSYPLKYDSELRIYYVCLDDRQRIEIDNGKCSNIPHQSFARNAAPVKEYNQKPKVAEAPKPTIKDIVFDYVTSGELEKAQFAIEIAKKLGIN